MIKKIEFKYVVLFIATIGFIILGSFYDFEITKKLYIGQHFSNNFYGILFSFIGVIPTFVGWSFLGAILIGLMNKTTSKNNSNKKWINGLAILLFTLSFFYFVIL